jgi:two-component system phosphate regulon sensor histidine kinase PhoR
VKLGIRIKIILISLGVIAASGLAGDLYLAHTLERLLTDRVRDGLSVSTALVAEHASESLLKLSDQQGWDRLAERLGEAARARVTLIRADGVVLGDSELNREAVRRLENHRTRPEVIEALETGRGASVRFSTTLGQRMMYVAAPFRRGDHIEGVARVAMPLGDVETAVSQLHRLIALGSLVALAVAVLMSSFAAHLTARSVRHFTATAAKMAAGDLGARTHAHGGDELAALGRALDQLAESLSATLSTLRAERDLVSGILAGMQEGVLVLSAEGRVVLVNAALREMLLIGADAEGKTLLEAIRNAELKALLERAGAGETREPAEIEIPGLKPRRLLVHASALRGATGGRIAVCVDVTQLRKLESVRRDFVANASHELRTPVASIRSAAETLRSALGEPEAAGRFVEIIERNAERLHRLVDDLLDLSRIESREYWLSPEPMALGPFVDQILGLQRERAVAKHITLERQPAGDGPLVRADRRALEQVLSNLVDNAVKYGSEGARVTVSAEIERNLIRISVTDTGPGIAAQHLPRLFERFYRVDAGRSRELGGTGLGLSIVKHLVEAMGGTVTVESAPERGTRFSFTLPGEGMASGGALSASSVAG